MINKIVQKSNEESYSVLEQRKSRASTKSNQHHKIDQKPRTHKKNLTISNTKRKTPEKINSKRQGCQKTAQKFCVQSKTGKGLKLRKGEELKNTNTLLKAQA